MRARSTFVTSFGTVTLVLASVMTLALAAGCDAPDLPSSDTAPTPAAPSSDPSTHADSPTADSQPPTVQDPRGGTPTAEQEVAALPGNDLPLSPASAEQSAQAMLVLDASGSMWGRIDGRAKMEIARDVIERSMSQWPAGAPLGLVAYGHNKRRDCEDIELLVPLDAHGAKAVGASVRKVQPKGMTPLSDAVVKAAEALDYTKRRATVILVSDGKENCDRDPCAVADALEKAGADFTAHVIGFDVPEVDRGGLECLAQRTGGVFIEADNEAQLQDALQDARGVTADVSELVLGDATLSVPAQVPAGSEFDVTWTGPKNPGDNVSFAPAPELKQGRDVSYLSAHDFQSPVPLSAPEQVGTFTVVYQTRTHEVLATAETEVVPVAATLKAKDSVVAGAAFAVDWTGPNNQYDEVVIFDAKQNRLDRHYAYPRFPSPARLNAPDTAGTYELRFLTRRGKVLARRPLTVSAAESTLTIESTLSQEIVAGNKITVRWTGPGNKGDQILVLAADGTRYGLKSGFRPYSTKAVVKGNKPVELTVPEVAGDYWLAYQTRDTKKELARIPLHVAAAVGSVRAPAVVPPGKSFDVHWTGPGNANDRIAILAPGAPRTLGGAGASDARPSTVSVVAPKEPGDYRVVLRTADKLELASVKIRVAAP